MLLPAPETRLLKRGSGWRQGGLAGGVRWAARDTALGEGHSSHGSFSCLRQCPTCRSWALAPGARCEAVPWLSCTETALRVWLLSGRELILSSTEKTAPKRRGTCMDYKCSLAREAEHLSPVKMNTWCTELALLRDVCQRHSLWHRRAFGSLQGKVPDKWCFQAE